MKAVKDKLELKYVPLKTIVRWSRNVKRHDVSAIIKSIQRHGFRDPLSYDANLNKGNGGIVEGNGRDEALKKMFAENPKKPPRGVLQDGTDWLVPVLFGVDANSQAAAEAYGFDHNQITMMGGEIDINDMMSMYEEQAAQMLRDLQQDDELPTSITADDLDAMLDAERERLSESTQTLRPKTMLRILVSVPADKAMDVQEHIEAMQRMPGVQVDVSGNG